MANRKRWAGLVILAGLLLGVAEGAAWAACGTCQVCKCETKYILFDYCSCLIANEQSGSMCCEPVSISLNTFCEMDGNACYGIIVDGGGGSGGGGGTTCSYTNGWCPAECMNCSGGTRPAI
jgi:hypothetical protein